MRTYVGWSPHAPPSLQPCLAAIVMVFVLVLPVAEPTRRFVMNEAHGVIEDAHVNINWPAAAADVATGTEVFEALCPVHSRPNGPLRASSPVQGCACACARSLV